MAFIIEGTSEVRARVVDVGSHGDIEMKFGPLGTRRFLWLIDLMASHWCCIVFLFKWVGSFGATP